MSAQESPHSAQHAASHIETPRNLVVCIDGTSNQFGKKNSNVVEFYHLLVKDGSQLTFYTSGIGTYARPSLKSLEYYKQVLGHKIDLAIAWYVLVITEKNQYPLTCPSRNFEKIVMDAYQWLSETYHYGDKIFLIGFSRGAYQVRCLSAMIHRVGLIHRGNASQIPFAYELYADTSKDSREMAQHFKFTFSRDVQVHFVGVWDTVSSVGIVRDKTLPGTTDGMKHVTFFRQALALDERRVKFLPEYAYEGSSLPDDDTESQGDESETTSAAHPHTKEVWFSGTHSDIGGGNAPNIAMNRTEPPLRWMSYEATSAGLRMRPFERQWDIRPTISVHESLTPLWRPFELIPWKRPTYTDAHTQTYRPHLGSGRRLRAGQKVHSSVVPHEDNSSYVPKASLHDALIINGRSAAWNAVFKQHTWPKGGLTGFIELDLYDRAVQSVHGLTSDSLSENQLKIFKDIVSSPDGTRALREVPRLLDSIHHIIADGHHPTSTELDVVRIVTTWDEDSSWPWEPYGIYRIAATLLSAGWRDGYQIAMNILRRRHSSEFAKTPLAMSFHPKHESYATFQSDMVYLYGALQQFFLPLQLITTFEANKDRVSCTALSPDGESIASGSWESNVRVWNIQTKECRIHRGHHGAVVCVAYSMDGAHLASGSNDGEIIVWDVVTSKMVSSPLKGHTGAITSLAFAPNGTLISGGFDRRVLLWDNQNVDSIEESHKFRAFTGHDAPITCLTISSDCSHIISGSYDRTIRIWCNHNDTPHTRILYGHTGWITSLAFSPKGEYIVSGSTDLSVRTWKVLTGQSVTAPFQPSDDWIRSVKFADDGNSIISGSFNGVTCSTTIDIADISSGILYGHTGEVNAVSFSPRGDRLISGSDDLTIRVWDAKTGAEILHPLRGHEDFIRSVQFSTDGKLIVSASHDETVRIWDASTGVQQGQSIRNGDASVFSAEFSPDGKSIVTGSADSIARIWNIADRSKAPKVLKGHSAEIHSVQYSPNGKFIATGSWDNTARVWSTSRGKQIGRTFRDHDGDINCIAFSPGNSRRVVSGSDDQTLRIWDTKTGKAVADPMRGHEGWVLSVAYSRDGRRIVSGSRDDTVRVWDAETGETLHVLEGHTESVWSVAFSPDGGKIASASADGTIRLWDADTGGAVELGRDLK